MVLYILALVSLASGASSSEASGLSGRVAGDYSFKDMQFASSILRDIWGDRQMRSDLAALVYEASVPGKDGEPALTSSPAGNAAGMKNLANFQALANPASAAIGRDTLEFLNGAYNYGVNQVAIKTSIFQLNELRLRAQTLNRQFQTAGAALDASTASPVRKMNSNLSHRFWTAGFGVSEDADEKSGFSGYSYNSYGFITGFDKVVAANLALGAAFAYNKGDYEDKGALSHDSHIESHAFGLYGVYSTASGFFASIAGAFAYSANDIREMRRDPSAGAAALAAADYHNNTWAVSGAFGYDLKPFDWLTLTSSIGVGYAASKSSDHDGVLNGVATQRERDIRNDALFLPLEIGAQYEKPVALDNRLRFDARVSYAYNFNRDGIDGTIEYFGLNRTATAAVRGREAENHLLKLGAGLRYVFDRVDVGVKYDYLLEPDSYTHRLMGMVGIAF